MDNASTNAEETIRQLEGLIPGLRRYARTLTNDPSTADDLVQDCLEHAISRWSQRRGDRALRAWTYSILHNLAISHIRQKRRRGHHVAIEDAPENMLICEQTQDQAIELGQMVDLVRALPEVQRSIILLVAVEDFSYADAARILNIPIGTLMSRLSRARQKLRAKGGQGDENALLSTRPRVWRVK